MYRVLTCLAFEHDWLLVALAAAICLTASYAVTDIGWHARLAEGRARRGWILAAGGAAGVGVWATHFVAMLAYDPGVVMGYDTALTIASLAIAVGAGTAGIALTILRPDVAGAVTGGVVFGAGVAAMHYAGMASVQIPAAFSGRPAMSSSRSCSGPRSPPRPSSWRADARTLSAGCRARPC